MAGFFGFFNYEKEGPGIAKDAPKKRGIVVFFEIFFRNFWKFIPINLVYYLVSIFGITNGLANAGITNVARNTAREKHSFGLSDFFETIKKNWKQALIVGILNIIIYAVLFVDVFFFYQLENGIMSTICLGISIAMIFIFTVMTFYIWTLMITFKFSVKTLYTNSFKFAFLNLPKNFLCFLITVLIHAVYVAIFFLLPKDIVLIVEVLVYLVTYPAFKALMTQFFVFPSIKKFIIDPYYKEHPEEDIDKRKNLGLEVEEEEETYINEDGEEEQINVFED